MFPVCARVQTFQLHILMLNLALIFSVSSLLKTAPSEDPIVKLETPDNNLALNIVMLILLKIPIVVDPPLVPISRYKASLLLPPPPEAVGQ
ncbi:hypothetical protein Trydic_g4382 [Trypoxylus dichotomus]